MARTPRTAPSLLRWGFALAAAAAGAWASAAGFDHPTAAWAGALSSVVLALWLAEVVPPFVPTLLLLVAVPLALPAFTPRDVLGWVADPVLALFFGGFVLGEAARVHGIDRILAAAAVRQAHGRPRKLVATIALTTAFLSMWMSNIAAAALMVACVRPLYPGDDRLRRAVLVAVAFGANLGGMATPIGSGPNAIAIAAMTRPISFVSWMAFAVPLVAGALLVAIGLLYFLHRIGRLPATPSTGAESAVGTADPECAVAEPTPAAHEASSGAAPAAPAAPTPRPLVIGVLALVAIAAWLTEPLHGVDAPLVSLALAAVLFGSGLVPAARLRDLDWSTLLLIAGGIALGRLLEATGLLTPVASALASIGGPSELRLLALLAASACLSSVMSNTGTSALLVPLAAAAIPDVPSAPILVALAASFGMPFVVSTPPNAMAVGAGARASDLAVPGMVLLVGGCLVLAATGPWVLGMFGVG